MPQRTIQDVEIALIKAMLDREMKNKNIQFYFNRPERPVNSGRISTIRTGSYSNSGKIPAASAEELDSFIASFTPHGIGTEQPAGEYDIRQLFRKNSDARWYLHRGESEEHECKQDFDPKKLTPVVRAIAALANNKGGYIFFGIGNNQCRVDGAGPAFAQTDIADIVNKVKAHLAPTPSIIVKSVAEFDGRTVGFLLVEKHLDRPVVVYRDGDGLAEGDILYRYAGQSSRIKFADLRAMLDERDRRAQVALAKAAGALADVGTANAVILDTDKSTLNTNGRPIVLDEKLIEQIKFVREGQFEEKSGAPTLRLVGEVKTVTVTGPPEKLISREAIFEKHILDAFLKQEQPENPDQFILAGLAQSRMWLPIFYFARATGRSNSEIVDAIEAQKVAQKGKKSILLDRLKGQRTAFAKAVTQAARAVSSEVSSGKLHPPKVLSDVGAFAHGLTAVATIKTPLPDILSALQIGRELAEKADDKNAFGAICKAVCRVDEMFFGADDNEK
ncbi:ATP-binding protein [Bradyrhizobium sp. CSS354]|uniref:ATP-binding protein n=1 Tax=Bradyrhizobium sp. CSS354 TaxID=2699172 RepID=UPI0023B03F16|nr:ATP-binding protein [Bradyrhizobium sp. CSS354]MDE5463742.1 hypothetical protein [Bradyrhizobium sp. CSS354]